MDGHYKSIVVFFLVDLHGVFTELMLNIKLSIDFLKV